MCRSKKIPAIEAEFNEPFEECVKGFALMGYSIRATASAMDISPSLLSALCKTRNLRHYFKPQRELNDSCRGGTPKGTNHRQNYSDEYLLSLVRQHPNCKHFVKQTHVDYKTVRRHWGNLPWREIVAIAMEQ